jgi:hypothetical protein
MPAGLFDLLGPGLGLSAPPSGGPGLLTGTYYFYPSDRPAIGTMLETIQLNDFSVGDTSTAEVGTSTNPYSGPCDHLTTTLYATALIDLGADYNLSSWSAMVAPEDADAEIPACVLPPEIELAPGYSWWLECSTDDTTYTAISSGVLTEGSYNTLGAALTSITARYVRLICRIISDTYRASGYTLYLRVSDFRLYGTSAGTGGGTPEPPGPAIAVLGVCEGGQATIYQTTLVPGALYYEIWRITDAEPAPGVLVASGGPWGIPGGAVDADPFVDSPLPIGRPNVYRMRACNDSGCGPFVEVMATPCWEDGTDGACECDEAPVAHTHTEAAVVARTIVEASRESC